MAARALSRLIRRAGLAGGAALLVLLLASLLYALAAWIGSTWPRNAGWQEPEAGITIMVETNGVHTGIIVPVTNAIKDWRHTFPSAGQPRADGQLPTHLAIGWGEREVFLHVPSWADLELATALRIAVLGGEPLMRVSHYVHPAPSPDHRPVTLTPAQYRRLVDAISAALPPAEPGRPRPILRGSYAPDAYYEALGSYTLLQTCNSWVGAVLAEAGLAMGRWTPLAGGVMKWIPAPEGQAQ